MSDSSKKHHYVPQSILKRFSTDGAQKQLYVFDKGRKTSFPSSIRDAGSENHFNTLEVEGQTISFEGLFQTNDDQLAILFEKIISDTSLAALTAGDRNTLLEVVGAQIVRVKLLRTTIRSIAEQLQASMREAGIYAEEVNGFSIPTDQQIRRAALASILDLRAIIAGIQDKRLILFSSPAPMSLWISDNPVVVYNSFPYGERGLSSPGVEIYFPISSELVLGLYCPSIERKIQQALSTDAPNFDREKYTNIYRALQDGEQVAMNSATCRFYNSLQVLQSSRFLYAPKNDFADAYDILKRNPEAQEVKSLISVGKIGHAPLRRTSMPSGRWVIFYGKESHHMVKVEKWNENSDFIEFHTNDAVQLRNVLDDQPLKQVVLFDDGNERRGMREVKIEVAEDGVTAHVFISHEDEALNRILRSVR
jgi:hypothetical protein